MKKIYIVLMLCAVLPASLSFAATTSEDSLKALSLKALEKLKTVKAVPFQRTTHPDAQWFPDASFGFFVHWGIHSVAGLQPSWAMLEGYPYGSDKQEYWGKGYYTLLKKFNPKHYDPDKWMEAAAKAGMTYAVITSKHHDGYALWPSEYGDMSTKQYMNGRDLLRPYVDACHKYGLKVGFYYSPPDWANKWNQDKLMGGYDYNVGQLSELLTRYGKIDILWFDGGIENPEKVIAWVRLLQPHILINDRSGGGGDFATPECSTPDQAPDGWWEECNIWSGHWGYAPDALVNTNSWVMEKLVKNRSWGGNFLLSGVGPRPDGTLRPQIYDRMAKLAEWMAHSRESLIGAEPVDKFWEKFSNVPLTRRDGVWYLHVLQDHRGAAEVIGVPRPKEVKLLRTKTPLDHTYQGRTISITLPDTMRTKLNDPYNDVADDVIAVYWDKEPW
jgi:alpha-L-fucosidase